MTLFSLHLSVAFAAQFASELFDPPYPYLFVLRVSFIYPFCQRGHQCSSLRTLSADPAAHCSLPSQANYQRDTRKAKPFGYSRSWEREHKGGRRRNRVDLENKACSTVNHTSVSSPLLSDLFFSQVNSHLAFLGFSCVPLVFAWMGSEWAFLKPLTGGVSGKAPHRGKKEVSEQMKKGDDLK